MRTATKIKLAALALVVLFVLFMWIGGERIAHFVSLVIIVALIPVAVIVGGLTIALMVDGITPLFRMIWRQTQLRRNIGQSYWPSHLAFQTGQGATKAEEVFVPMLHDVYRRQFGVEPLPSSFSTDQEYIRFRRRHLPRIVFSSAYRPIVEDLFASLHSAFLTGQLDPKLSSAIEHVIEDSQRRRHPLAATMVTVRVLTFGKIGMKPDDVMKPVPVGHFRSNPGAFIKLMDEHFFTLAAALPDAAMKSIPKADRIASRSREVYRMNHPQLARTASPSSQGPSRRRAAPKPKASSPRPRKRKASPAPDAAPQTAPPPDPADYQLSKEQLEHFRGIFEEAFAKYEGDNYDGPLPEWYLNVRGPDGDPTLPEPQVKEACWKSFLQG